MARIISQIAAWASLVKFSHTVFALPFALAMAVVCSRYVTVSFAQVGWIVFALVSARTSAMAFNRVVDRYIDAKNPRTEKRELPSGKLSLGSVVLLLLGSAAVFHLSALMLGKHCLYLAPLVLIFLYFYSYTKRFTSASHMVLGIALSLAPGGVWYALTAKLTPFPLPLMLAVAFWVAGFDILYAMQDREFDLATGLFSIPASVGLKGSLLIARLSHAVSVVLLLVFGVTANLGIVYFVGSLIFGVLLISEHRLVSVTDLSKIDAAFFNRNALASLFFFSAVVCDHFFNFNVF